MSGILLFFGFIASFFIIPCQADTIAWTNTSGGNWSVPANWSPNEVPGASDDVFITANGTYLVTLDTSPTVNSLTLGASSGQQTLTNSGFAITLNIPGIIGTNGILALTGSGATGITTLTGSAMVSGTLNIAAGQVNGALSVLNGGVFNATNVTLYGGDVTDGGTFNWSGVQFDPGASLVVMTNGVLNIEGNFYLLSEMTNEGTVNWQAGEIAVDYYIPWGWYGEIWNETNALWDIQCDQTMQGYSGEEQFHNAGVMQKDTATGVTSFIVYLNNTGTVHVESGTISFGGWSDLGGGFQADAGAAIYFDGGAYTLNSPPNFQGPGAVQFATANLTLNEFTGAFILQPGVTLIGQNTVEAAGAVTLNGDWLGAGSSLTVASNGVLNIAGTVGIGGALTNYGTVNWLAGEVQVANGQGYTGVIWNEAGALWDIQCDESLANQFGGEEFHNDGVLQKDTTTGATTVTLYLNNTGTVHAESGSISFNEGSDLGGIFQADSGAAIYFNGGSYSLSRPPTNFQGPGPVQFATANLTLNEFTGAFILQPGVTLIGQNTVEAAGAVTLIGDWLGAGSSLTIASNGVLNIAGTVGIGGALTNYGTVNWLAGEVQVANGQGYTGVIWNEAGALWDIQCDESLANQFGGEEFHNDGVLQKDTTTGATTVTLYLNNTGTVHAESGSISFNGGSDLGGTFQADSGAAIYFAGGAYTLSSAPNFQGPGTVQFTGNVTVALTSPITNLALTGVTVTGLSNLAGTASLTNCTINDSETIVGVVNCDGLTIIGYGPGNVSALTVASNGVLNLVGNDTHNIEEILDNYGTVNWQGGYIQVNANLDVNGMFFNEAGAVWNIQCDQTLQDWSYLYSWTSFFDNWGVLEKTAGTNTTSFNLYLYNDGILDAESGLMSLNRGVDLTGGTMNFSISSLTNYGGVYLSQNPSTLDSSVGVYLNNGYVPAPGDSFPVLTFASASGSFTNLTNLSSSSGVIWQTNYTATALVLTDVGQIAWAPADITYGAALGASQLNASTTPSVAGTFTYNPAAGTVLNSGAGRVLTATFAPSDPSCAPASYQAQLAVLQAPLGVTATNQSKTYGQTFGFAGTEFVVSGLVNGDTVTSASLASAGVIADAPVSGSPYAITINNAQGDAGLTNYIVTYTTGVLTVNRAGLAVTANPASRAYGATNPTLGATCSGFVNGETASVVSGAPGFSTPATVTTGVGNYGVTPSLGTLAAANYTFGPFLNGTLTINPATLAIASGLTANNKTYDRTTTATLSSNNVALTNIFNGDTINLNTNGYVAHFASAGTGNSVGVTVSGLTLSGARATNYTLTQPANLTANLTAAPVSISSGITANNKVYDRTTTATLSSNSVVLLGVVNGDTVSLNTNGYVANFASAGVGSGIAVTLSGLTLAGASAANYSLTQPAGLTASIIAASLQLMANLPNVVLFWTTNANAFALMQTPSLAPPITWTSVTSGIAVNGTNYTFTNNAISGNQFFKLIATP